MNCEQYQAMLSEFLDDELAEEMMTPLFSHVATCSSCRETLQAFIGLRAALRSASEETTHTGRRSEVRYADAPPRFGSFRKRIRVPMPAVVLVSVAFLMALLFVIHSMVTRESRPLTGTNVYVITEPVEVRGYYSTHQQPRQ